MTNVDAIIAVADVAAGEKREKYSDNGRPRIYHCEMQIEQNIEPIKGVEYNQPGKVAYIGAADFHGTD